MSTPNNIPAIPRRGEDPTLFYTAIRQAVLDNVASGVSSSAIITQLQSQVKAAQSVLSTVSSSNPSSSGYNAATVNFNIYSKATPPTLTGLNAVASNSYVILTWDKVPYTNQAFVNIYRSTTNDFTTAAAVGTSRFNLFADYTNVLATYYYWITSVSWGGIEGPPNSPTGTAVQTTTIGDLAQTTGVIGANQIDVVNLAAISADMGNITAGQLENPDGTFVIDLVDKQITIAGANGIAADDYMIMQNGNVTFFKWTGSTHQQGQSLQTIESGTANNGDLVTLQKWYASNPNIIVGPNNLPAYNATYSAQSQTIQMYASNITNTNGTVTFNAVAQLVLSGSNPTTVVNGTSGAISSNTYSTSPDIVTSANCVGIEVNASAISQLGTGVQPNYYYRVINARIAYKVNGSGGGYSYTPYTQIVMGANFATYNLSINTGTISNNTYQFHVEYVASNTGYTFQSGAMTYTYQQTVVSNSGVGNSLNLSDTTYWATIYMPGVTPNAGYTVYEVDWSFTYDYTFRTSAVGDYIGYPNGSAAAYPAAIGSGNTNTVSGAFGSCTTYSFNTVGDNYSLLEVHTPNDTTYCHIDSAYATVKSRAAFNSTTPVNTFNFVSYQLTLSTATVINSGGVLNWVAIE